MEQQEQQLMKLEGTVEHVIYENADSGYAVFEVDAGGTDVVVAGNVGGVDNGMSVTVYGHMGREDLGVKWENTDRVDALKAAVAE